MLCVKWHFRLVVQLTKVFAVLTLIFRFFFNADFGLTLKMGKSDLELMLGISTDSKAQKRFSTVSHLLPPIKIKERFTDLGPY